MEKICICSKINDMKEKIGILCASDTELMPFLKSIHPLRTVKKAMLEFHIGRVGKINVIMVYSGVCKVNAAIAAQVLIDFFHVDACFLGEEEQAEITSDKHATAIQTRTILLLLII